MFNVLLHPQSPPEQSDLVCIASSQNMFSHPKQAGGRAFRSETRSENMISCASDRSIGCLIDFGCCLTHREHSLHERRTKGCVCICVTLTNELHDQISLTHACNSTVNKLANDKPGKRKVMIEPRRGLGTIRSILF